MIDVLASVTRATLAFDLARVDANMQRIAAAARAHAIRALFAAKSFPHPRVLELAASRLDGFDVASPGELVHATRGIVSVADPTGAAIAAATGARVIVACETIEQVRAAPRGAEIAIRISASITGLDPAIGAVLDGSGHRRSRFGLDDRASIAAVRDAAAGRRVGVHVHHGPVTPTSADRFIATARAAIELADFEPAFIDLGGAWHGIADFAEAFAAIRVAFSRSIELFVEPGRAYAEGSGFACGIVRAARSLGDRELRVVDLSRACHLRWSTFELVARAPHPGRGRRMLVVGPTCYEEDVLGEWTVEREQFDERVIVRGISGYALAWNCGFGGIAPADVVIA